jgi:ABC-type arginine/histidine transport system permease subunit
MLPMKYGALIEEIIAQVFGILMCLLFRCANILLAFYLLAFGVVNVIDRVVGQQVLEPIFLDNWFVLGILALIGYAVCANLKGGRHGDSNNGRDS